MPTNDELRSQRYLAIGDSITQGTPFVPAGKTYPEIFERLTGNQVMNIGIGGLTVAEMEMDFASHMEEFHPSVVFLQGGGNDIDYGRDAEEIIDDFSSIFEMSEKRGVILIVCTILPSSLDQTSESIRNSVNDWIRGHMDRYGYLADIDIKLRDPIYTDRIASEFDSGDGIHPNATGMNEIALTIYKRLAIPK
jgi:lysophospholipase L1-like esterase